MAKKAAKDEQVTLSADGVKGRKALHKRALERYKVLDEYWAENAKKSLEAIKFRAGEEWPEDIKRIREGAQNPRPCLSFRRGEQYIRQVMNDGRQKRPSVKYRPIGDGADVEVANAFQGLTRHILASSNAAEALDTALDHSAGNGFGYFRVLTEYEQEGGFEQRTAGHHGRAPGRPNRGRSRRPPRRRKDAGVPCPRRRTSPRRRKGRLPPDRT